MSGETSVRKGQAVPDQLMTIETLVLVLLLVVFVLSPVALGVASGLSAGFAEMDAHDLYASVTLMNEQGTAQRTIELANSYERIRVDGGEISLEAGFLDGPLTASLPSRYDYPDTVLGEEGGSLPGDINPDPGVGKICVTKSARTYSFSAGECSEPEPCSPGRCEVWVEDGEPVEGFYCSGGAYTREGFFRHYYSSDAPGCGEETGEFAAVNRLVCPDRVQDSGSFGCYVSATWKCDGDADVSIEVDGSAEMEETVDCGEGVKHRRFFTGDTIAGGEYTVTGSISVAGDSDSRQREVTLE